MIKSIGIDILEIDRLSQLPDKNLFLSQILDQRERDRVRKDDRHNNASSLFTIKEAVMKALGCGLSKGYFWKDIIVDDPHRILLKKDLKRIADEKEIKKIHCSTSSTKKLSISVIVLEGQY